MILYILLAIFVLLLMIMIHETGHYLAGKLLKFKIEEYSIGFGKAIFTKKMKSGEVFSLRWIPLGGYCAFKGEDEDGNEDPECFNSYPCWKRLIVLFSGAFFNFISAVIFSFILLVSIGSGISVITSVDSDSINSNVIQVNDVIIEVNGVEPTFMNGGAGRLIKDIGVGEDINMVIRRDGKELNVVIQKYEKYEMKDGEIVKDDDGNPVIEKITTGLHDDNRVRYGFGEALFKCVPYTFNMAWECLVILGDLVTGNLGLDSVGGPITTIQTIAVSTEQNISSLILLFPLIAVNLAVFNLLPIPALDGARMLFVLIEWIFRKPVPRNIEGWIHMIGLFVLFGFVILVDILQLFVF